MLEYLNRKKVLRAKILMQNVFKWQIPPRNFTEERCIAGKFWERVSVIFCCVSTFKEIYKFLHKNQTQILLKYLYTKHNFQHVIVNKKGQEGSLSKHCSRNALKWQILRDSIIPWSRSESRKCFPNSNHEVFVVISFLGFLFLPMLRCWYFVQNDLFACGISYNYKS